MRNLLFLTNSNAVLLTLVPILVFIILIVNLIYKAMTVIAWWKIFTKAGFEGWYSLVPFLAEYKQFEIATGKAWCSLPYIMGFFLISISKSTDSFATFLAGMCLYVPTLFFLCIGLSKAFGKDKAFTIGLILFNGVFAIILGFGDNTYLGLNGQVTSDGADRQDFVQFNYNNSAGKYGPDYNAYYNNKGVKNRDGEDPGPFGFADSPFDATSRYDYRGSRYAPAVSIFSARRQAPPEEKRYTDSYSTVRESILKPTLELSAHAGEEKYTDSIKTSNGPIGTVDSDVDTNGEDHTGFGKHSPIDSHPIVYD